jgi:hypothetical protein
MKSIEKELTENIKKLRVSLRKLHPVLSGEKRQQEVVQADHHLESMMKYIRHMPSIKDSN